MGEMKGESGGELKDRFGLALLLMVIGEIGIQMKILRVILLISLLQVQVLLIMKQRVKFI